jgi:hypothetical protein
LAESAAVIKDRRAYHPGEDGWLCGEHNEDWKWEYTTDRFCSILAPILAHTFPYIADRFFPALVIYTPNDAARPRKVDIYFKRLLDVAFQKTLIVSKLFRLSSGEGFTAVKSTKDIRKAELSIDTSGCSSER